MTQVKILACVDGSSYADNIIKDAAWMVKRLDAAHLDTHVDVLHVLRRPSDYEAPSHDHTGSIGIGARKSLLDALSKVDQDRSKLDLAKGEIILEHAETLLKEHGVRSVETHHRRGALVDTILEFEKDYDIIVMGKRGEHADIESEFLGSNLEKTARVITKPLFLTSFYLGDITKFVIAYDGKKSARKAVNYAVQNPLLKGLDCHLLCVTDNAFENIDSDDAVARLKDAGFNVTLTNKVHDKVGKAINAYVKDEKINLLLTGAYSHSRMVNFFLGSTTSEIIKSCHIPVMLFR